MNIKLQKGFTLIELVIVVAIPRLQVSSCNWLSWLTCWRRIMEAENELDALADRRSGQSRYRGAARPQRHVRTQIRAQASAPCRRFRRAYYCTVRARHEYAGIQSFLEEAYGIEVSPTFISQVTDAAFDEVRAWQARPLDAVYPMRISMHS